MDEQHQQDQGQQLQFASVKELTEQTKELVNRDVREILERHGLLATDGKPDRIKLADRLEPMVRAAVVNAPGERTKATVWAHDLTAELFGDVPGPALWVEQDDPLRAEKVYGRIRGEIVRVLNTKPDGEMQRRFAENGGLVLCEPQTRPTGGDTGWYVTRNPSCINEDLNGRRARRPRRRWLCIGHLNELSMSRVPEYAGRFDTGFKAGVKLITDGPTAGVKAAAEAARSAAGDGDE